MVRVGVALGSVECGACLLHGGCHGAWPTTEHAETMHLMTK
jgi:hypothetical protein